MEVKLKLILEKIHWSLIFKSLFLGLIWFFLPFWIFFCVILLFYFIPIFRPAHLLFQFLIFIFISKIIEISLLNFLFLTILIFLIFGIKDLIIIRRDLAYQILGLLYFFILILKFFEKFGSEFNWSTIIFSFLLSIIFILFFKNKIFFETNLNNFNYLNFKIGLGIMAFLIWQLILVLCFLPMNFYLQTAILILFISLGFETIIHYAVFGLNKQFILANSLIF
ncbi:MAG: hypothetical protein NZ484_01320, partial [Patescibacteria group bacterium]|nr:hypothetical protein [Patescibacteria group bacterium]